MNWTPVGGRKAADQNVSRTNESKEPYSQKKPEGARGNTCICI